MEDVSGSVHIWYKLFYKILLRRQSLISLRDSNFELQNIIFSMMDGNESIVQQMFSFTSASVEDCDLVSSFHVTMTGNYSTFFSWSITNKIFYWILGNDVFVICHVKEWDQSRNLNKRSFKTFCRMELTIVGFPSSPTRVSLGTMFTLVVTIPTAQK